MKLNGIQLNEKNEPGTNLEANCGRRSLGSVLAFLNQQAANADNVLAIGSQAKSQNQVEIPVRGPENYNFKTKEEILNLRRRYVGLIPNLVQDTYRPSEEVFGAIVDHKPWWGMQGRSVWGSGERSIEGPAEESRFLSNPFLLVGADPASAGIFRADLIEPADLNRPDFPYAWQPKRLTWWPRKRLGQVIYDVSTFNNELFQLRMKLIDPVIYPAFNLVAYNARDLGFHYIWLAEDKSINIENMENPKPEPVEIRQMIHCGGTCGYNGGCNNMSPEILAIDRIKYTKLPARAYVKLWQEKPKSVNDEADMVFMIDLR